MRNIAQSVSDPPDRANSFAACIASILEVSIDSIPDFAGDYGERWFSALADWLMPMNLSVTFLGYDAQRPLPRGYSILTCIPPGMRHSHCFVALDGKIVWDPCPIKKQGPGEPKYWTVFTVLDPGRLITRPVFEKIFFQKSDIGQ